MSNTRIAGAANCGCVYHAEHGIPCEHDLLLTGAECPDGEACKLLKTVEGCPLWHPEAKPADTRERLLWDVLEELPSVERYLGYTRGRVPQAMAKSIRAFLKRAEALGILSEERP